MLVLSYVMLCLLSCPDSDRLSNSLIAIAVAIVFYFHIYELLLMASLLKEIVELGLKMLLNLYIILVIFLP